MDDRISRIQQAFQIQLEIAREKYPKFAKTYMQDDEDTELYVNGDISEKEYRIKIEQYYAKLDNEQKGIKVN